MVLQHSQWYYNIALWESPTLTPVMSSQCKDFPQSYVVIPLLATATRNLMLAFKIPNF